MNPKVEIIVAGELRIAEGKRDEFVERSRDAIGQARLNGDCIDFSVSADSIEPHRVNIFEAWASMDALEKFRGEGPEDELSKLIEGAKVVQYRVSNDQ